MIKNIFLKQSKKIFIVLILLELILFSFKISTIQAYYVKTDTKQIPTGSILYEPYSNIAFNIPASINPYAVDTFKNKITISNNTIADKYEFKFYVGYLWNKVKRNFHLEYFKFKNSNDVAKIILKDLKQSIPVISPSFKDLGEKEKLYITEVNYKTLNYLKLFEDSKKKKVDKKNYYEIKKGFIVIDVIGPNTGGVALFIRDASSEDVAIKTAQVLFKSLYFNPLLIKEQTYKLGDTNITAQINIKKWNVSTNKDGTIFLSFIAPKYEETQDLASVVLGYTARISIFTSEINYKTNDEFEKGIYKLFIKNYPKDFYKWNKQKQQQWIQAQINDIKPQFTKKQHPYLGTLLCKTKKDFPLTNMFGKKIPMYKQECYAYNNSTLITIFLSYVPNSNGYKEAEKVINSLQKENNNQPKAKQANKTIPILSYKNLITNFNIFPEIRAVSTLPTKVEPISEGELLGFFSTYKIFSIQCSNLRIPTTNLLNDLNLSGRVFKMCLPETGSGVSIAPNVLVSNSHVLYSSPLMDVYEIYNVILTYLQHETYPYSSLDGGFSKELLKAARIIAISLEQQGYLAPGSSNDPKIISEIAGNKLLKYIASNLKPSDIQKVSYKAWATQGINSTFKITDYNIALTNQQNLIPLSNIHGNDITGTYFPDTKKPIEPDVAIAKFTTSNPTNNVVMPLANMSFVRPGLDIWVAGFPGVIEENSSLMQTKTYPTLSRGRISSIRSTKGAFKMLQIDAAASNGNSGGPVILDNGNLAGLLTVGYTKPDSDVSVFNGAIYVDSIQNMLNKYNISTNATSQSSIYLQLAQAVDYYNNHKFKLALPIFQKIRDINPSYYSYMLDPIILNINSYIKAGLDKTTLIDNIKNNNLNKSTLIILGGGTLAGLLLIIGGIVIVIKSKPKQTYPQNVNQPTNVSNQPTTPLTPTSNATNNWNNTQPLQQPQTQPVQSMQNQVNSVQQTPQSQQYNNINTSNTNTLGTNLNNQQLNTTNIASIQNSYPTDGQPTSNQATENVNASLTENRPLNITNNLDEQPKIQKQVINQPTGQITPQPEQNETQNYTTSIPNNPTINEDPKQPENNL